MTTVTSCGGYLGPPIMSSTADPCNYGGKIPTRTSTRTACRQGALLQRPGCVEQIPFVSARGIGLARFLQTIRIQSSTTQ
eukprot:scaffold460495_cov15-Prasinocladus_malaysianus.AAC.1